MENDLLYDCAVAYSKLMDTQFKFTLASQKEIIEAKLSFDKTQFRHLAGLHKLTDITTISAEEISSSNLYDMIIGKSVAFNDISNSIHFNIPINASVNTSKVEYFETDRIMALSNLHYYMHNFDIAKVKAFKWQKDGDTITRPHLSDISADILISFSDTVRKKTQSEQVCSFFIEASNQNEYNGVTIFPLDVPYSDDGRISVPEYKILSVQEKCISTGLTTVLYDATVEEKAKANEQVANTDRNKTIANDIKSLKNKRNKVIENPSVGNQNKYNKQLAIFKNRNIYSDDMVKEVINRLNDQLTATKDEKVADMIKSEISYLQNDVLERQQSPTQQLTGISISKIQANNDSTLSVNNIATIPIPKAITETPKMIQRKTHTMTGTVKSMMSDISDGIKKLFSPKSKPKSVSKARTTKSDKSTTPKKKAVKTPQSVSERKPVKQVAQDKPKVQEKRKSVLSELDSISSAQKQNEQQRSHQRTKSKSNNIDI